MKLKTSIILTLIISLNASAGTGFSSKLVNEMTGTFTLTSGESNCPKKIFSIIELDDLGKKKIRVSTGNEDEMPTDMYFTPANATNDLQLHRCEFVIEKNDDMFNYDCRKNGPPTGPVLSLFSFRFTKLSSKIFSYQSHVIYGDEYNEYFNCNYKKNK